MSDEDRSYKEELRGKSVALVGPAETLFDQDDGNEIDSFDVIVRLNNAHEMFPFSPSISRAAGRRTNVLYLCPSELVRLCDEHIDAIIKAGVRTLVTWSYRAPDAQRSYNPADPDEDLTEGRIRSHLDSLRLSCHLRVVHLPQSQIEATWDLVSANPKTGFVALIDLLNRPIIRLHITGMTFMHGGGHMFRKYLVITPETNHKGETTTSDPRAEIRYLRKLLEVRSVPITIDLGLLSVLDTVA